MAHQSILVNHAGVAIRKAQRKKLVFISVSLLIVIFLVVFLIFHFIQAAQDKKIAAEYVKIYATYSHEEAVYQQQVKDKTVAAKQTSADHSQSMLQFATFAQTYPKNPYGWQAAIMASSYFIRNSKLDQVENVINAVLPYTELSNFLQIRLRTALAGVYANENKIPQAIAELTVVENLPRNPLPNQSRYLKAEIYASVGQTDQAKKILNQIISSPMSVPYAMQQNDEIVHLSKILLSKMG